MSTYKIRITETLSRCVDVEALNEEDAINKVHDMYNDCEIVLGADDFVGPVNIECVK
jgi:hypothetical protein